jgi:hypothetical protein
LLLSLAGHALFLARDWRYYIDSSLPEPPQGQPGGLPPPASRAFHPGGLVGQVDPPIADENLHAFALRQNLVLTQIDPIANEMVRVEHVMKGHRADDHNPG